MAALWQEIVLKSDLVLALTEKALTAVIWGKYLIAIFWLK